MSQPVESIEAKNGVEVIQAIPFGHICSADGTLLIPELPLPDQMVINWVTM
jgi:hypothetical protein